jgi:maleylacetoacetate isomerase
MRLYSYWRSTTSYRVRAALNLKGLAYDITPVDLVAGEQRSEAYRGLNAGAGVPTLVLANGTVLTQSLAIIDYLDATWPEPRLIPADPLLRARVLAVAHGVAMDIHPVNNLRVLGALTARFGATADQKTDWMRHWMAEGFAAIEPQIAANTAFAFGSAPNLADICITAQVYNAQRWGLPLETFPRIARITENCLNIPAIRAAHPDNQPDKKENL